MLTPWRYCHHQKFNWQINKIWWGVFYEEATFKQTETSWKQQLNYWMVHYSPATTEFSNRTHSAPSLDVGDQFARLHSQRRLADIKSKITITRSKITYSFVTCGAEKQWRRRRFFRDVKTCRNTFNNTPRGLKLKARFSSWNKDIYCLVAFCSNFIIALDMFYHLVKKTRVSHCRASSQRLNKNK